MILAIRPSNRTFLKACFAGLFCLWLLGGCNLGYYSQAIGGHLEIQRKSRPISELLADKGTPESLNRQLAAFVSLRRFAHKQLLLPDQGSYQDYADLGRPFVTWMLIATPEFSLEPKPWCFPLVGCLPYQGFFKETDAQEQARLLKAQGMDVKLAGSPAYSSLGWFKDPLLNTMLRAKDIQLAETLFHELAHQRLYFKDDTAFNEAFASAVAEHGVGLWLRESGRIQELSEYHKNQQRSADFRKLTQATRRQLEQLYTRQMAPEAMRQQKAAIFRQMQTGYQQLKKEWNGYGGYDNFMAQELNNAHLALVSTYQALVPDFQRLLESCQQSLPDFYQTLAGWKPLSQEGRRARLKVAPCQQPA